MAIIEIKEGDQTIFFGDPETADYQNDFIASLIESAVNDGASATAKDAEGQDVTVNIIAQ